MKQIIFSFAVIIFLMSFRAQADFKNKLERATEKVAEKTAQAGKRVTDASITAEVKSLLLSDSQIEAYRINVDTRNKIVYLKGTVPNRKMVSKAVQKARRAKGVRKVVNMLRVQP